MAWWGLWMALAYLAGSVPFGYLMARARGLDIRQHGSGNIGATNVGRVLGKKWGRICLALDILKGIVPVLASGAAMGMIGGTGAGAREVDAGGFWGSEDDWLWLGVAAAAVLGHMYPVWLRLKGGKGVATGLGAMLGVFPVLTAAGGAALVAWLVTARLTRYVSVSSCVAALALPAAVLVERWAVPGWGANGAHLVVASALAGLVIWRHRGNLQRLAAGTEPRMGEARGVEPPRA